MKQGKKNKILAVVCDGIGGLQEGEEASSYVVRQLINWFLTEGYKRKTDKKQQYALQQLCFQLHEELKLYGKEKEICLGTTATIILGDNKRLIWVHCGDCRFYLIRGKKIKLISKDQSEKRGSISRAIGVGEWHLLMTGCLKIKTGDRFLLCSDGFYRNMEEDELGEWAKRKIEDNVLAERMLKQMFQKKVLMGEKDNISALYLGCNAKKRN